MTAVILVIHLFLALTLIGLVLLQRSEGGALGIGGGGGSMGGLMSTRGQANLLSRATGVVAACFFATSLGLAILAGAGTRPASIVDRPSATQPSEPAAPQIPSVPLAR